MSNSPLVNYTRISPNRNSPRNHEIDTITIHCVVGQCTVESLGAVFAPKERQGSSNYGVGYDGRIGMYVEEKDRSWCSSSGANDHRAITIEVASDTKPPYAVTDKAYNALIDLCADICKRNGIAELKWKGDKSLVGNIDEQNMTVHKWFAATACPGEYLYERMGQIAAAVNAKLGKKILKDVKTIAQEVLDGKWGNGTDRKNALEAAGYDYQEVQTLVNELVKGPVSKPATEPVTPKRVTAKQSAYKYDKSLSGEYRTLSDLYLRDGAGTRNEALCLIPIGTKVRCYGYYNELDGGKWLYIQVTLNGVLYTGFSSSAYLKK